MRPFAKIGFAAALVLASDFSAAFATDLYRASMRRRIGRVVVSPVSGLVPFGSPMRFGLRNPFDYYGDRRIVPNGKQIGQNEIVTSLRQRGFHDIGTPQHRGSTYIIEATGPLGERVRLIVNGVTGGIDGVRIIGSTR